MSQYEQDNDGGEEVAGIEAGMLLVSAGALDGGQSVGGGEDARAVPAGVGTDKGGVKPEFMTAKGILFAVIKERENFDRAQRLVSAGAHRASLETKYLHTEWLSSSSKAKAVFGPKPAVLPVRGPTRTGLFSR